MIARRCIQLILGAALMAGSQAALGDDNPPQKSLDSMSIEELMDLEISSASRKPQEQQRVPAAVFVITDEDIAHSTATTIPELLRMAPGVNVARIDASKWSVTMRGFGGRLADKLLVLVDGRSVYSPTFSGVSWEDLNYPLELIERIEVIRGPGGASWGANAVNGIINIITRRASENDGGLVSITHGKEINSGLSALYFGKLSPNRHLRFYLRDHRGDDGGLDRPRVQADDQWRGTRAGLGMEWDYADDWLRLEASAMESNLHDTYVLSPFRPPFRRFATDESRARELTLNGVWERSLENDGALSLRASIQRYETDTILGDETRTTGELDFQHRFHLTERQELVWGLGFRFVADRFGTGSVARFDPDARRYRTFSGFIQDELRFFDDTLHLTAGAKFEHNDFTGLEIQPTLRLAWLPNDHTTWWAAITRVIGTPSRVELDARVRAFALPGLDVELRGDDGFDAEQATSIEAGLRRRFGDTVSVDIAAFYTDYDDLRTTAFQPPFFGFQWLPPRVLLQSRTDNNAGAIAKGVEVSLRWTAHPRWQTRVMYSYLDIGVNLHTPYPDPLTAVAAGDTPSHQVFWQNRFLLSESVNLDIDFRYVGALDSLGIDAYSTMDARLSWRPREDLEFELSGQNLLQPDHTELTPTIVDTLPSATQRGVYAQITWEF